MLQEAKDTLLQFAYFGISEYPMESYELFTRTFVEYPSAMGLPIFAAPWAPGLRRGR